MHINQRNVISMTLRGVCHIFKEMMLTISQTHITLHARSHALMRRTSLLFSAAKTTETTSGAQLSDCHRLSYFSERSDARQRGNARYRTLALGNGSKLVRSVTACSCAWLATDSGYRSPCVTELTSQGQWHMHYTR